MANIKKQKIVDRLTELEAMEATLLPEEKSEMEDLKKRLEKIEQKEKEKTDDKEEKKDKLEENTASKKTVTTLKGNVWYKGVHYLQGTEIDTSSATYKVFKEINLVD